MSFLKPTKNLLYKLFPAKKPSLSAGRLALFVFLAVSCFLFPILSHAIGRVAGSTPQPGEPLSGLSQGWQDQINNSNNIFSFTNVFNKDVKTGGIVPTSPNEYGAFLKIYGGYDWNQANMAGITNAQYLIANPKQTGGLLTYSDKDLLDKWQNSKIVDQPLWNYGTAPVAQAASTAGGAINSAVGAVGNFAGSVMNQIAIDVVITVLTILAGFCKMLLMYAGQALDMTLNPGLYNFTSNQMVVGGWIIVRDVCNLFFLLVLLFIAICTILKIEKYHAKKTLLMLIIMALLINFSKPIAVFIFDGSQLLMNMFLSEITKTGQGSPAAKLAADIAEFLYKDLMTNLVSQGNSWEIAVYYLFVVVFLFMFAVALFVMFLFMIIRIIAIMILVIVSPLAFFAAIVPDFSKMSSQWWSSLFEYSYYGPAAAFFLFLATKFAISNSNSNILPQINIQGDGQMVIQHIIRYAVVLVFLYASIFMAKKFGGGAGAAIVKNADRFMKWGTGMTKTGGVWGWGSRATGLTGGFSQAAQYYGLPTSWMTKAGRQKNQARMAARVASALGVKGAWFNTFQKRAKEENEGLDNDSVIAKAQAGDQYAALQAVMNGDGDDLGVFNTVLDIVKDHPEVRLHFRHLYRKANQTQFAAELLAYTATEEEIDKNRKEVIKKNPTLTGDALQKKIQDELVGSFAGKEIERLQKDGLAKLDFRDFADNPYHVKEESHRNMFRQELLKKLNTFAEVNPSDFADLLSSSKIKNQEFVLQNKDFSDVLEKARMKAKGS